MNTLTGHDFGMISKMFQEQVPSLRDIPPEDVVEDLNNSQVLKKFVADRLGKVRDGSDLTEMIRRDR